MNPTPYTVGQQVYVSKQNLSNVIAHCRSLLTTNPKLFPAESYMNTVRGLWENRTLGIVEQVWFSHHKVIVKFDNEFRLQMEYGWITDLPEFGPEDGIE
jgi:hypothetical protein